MKKNSVFKLSICIFIIIGIITMVSLNVLADFDYSKPYQTNHNYSFTLEDRDSKTINELYPIDDAELPSSFSLADKMNIVVSDQKDLPLCDLFATVKAAELSYAYQTGEYIDLSERYVDYMTSKYFYGYRETGITGSGMNNGVYIGGDPSDTHQVGMFIETIGVASEEDVPLRNYTDEEIKNLRNVHPAVRATGYVELPFFAQLKDNNERQYWMNIVKKHILKYGALRVAISATGSNNYNNDTAAMNFKKGVTESLGGHGIVVLGWDDNYSKDNFIVKPQNDGAFICLNSYGEEFGKNGLFWISYESESFNQLTGFLEMKKASNTTEYSNTGKMFWHSSNQGYQNYMGFKFEKNSDVEYFSHLVLDGFSMYRYSEEGVTNSIIKVHFFLNPKDDSFDKDKMILLQTTELDSRLNLSVFLDTPIKLEGDKYSIVVQFEGDPGNIYFFNNPDEDNEIITYSSEGFDKEWKKNSYNMPIFAYTINKKVTKATLKNPPHKTSYIKGEQLDLDGCTGLIEYDDGTIEEIAFTDDNTSLNGFDSNKLGNQTITLDYKGHSFSFNISVKNAIKSIKIKENPAKLTYQIGDELDVTGGIVTVSYEDGSKIDIPMTSSNVYSKGFDSKKEGKQEITIKYGEFSTQYNVEVVSHSLQKIEIKKKPNKTSYVEGEKLDLEGGIITAKYSDGSSSDIDMNSKNVKYSNFDPKKIGTQNVEIVYKDLKTNVEITVKEKSRIKSISIKKEPTKVEYFKGENISVVGGILYVEYTDDTVTEIPMDADEVFISAFDTNSVGTQKITVTYNGKQTSFNVNVQENSQYNNGVSQDNQNDKTMIIIAIAIATGVVFVFGLVIILINKNGKKETVTNNTSEINETGNNDETDKPQQ